jgi:CheY-like chemotaxis protein
MSNPAGPSALCIFVIDDDRDTVDSFAALLTLQGHVVHTACDGEQALEQIGALHPDVVFVDLSLPGMDGFEIGKRIRREPRLSATKIIAVTGHTDSKHRQRAQYAGFDGYVLKPATLDEIMRTIESVRQALQMSGQGTHPSC